MSEDAIIRRSLVETAEEQTTIFYSDLGALIRLDMSQPDQRTELSDLLGRINIAEHEEGRPMLSAVAVLKDEMRPGQGFFEIAHRIGRYDGNKDPRVQERFFIAELKRVYACWAK